MSGENYGILIHINFDLITSIVWGNSIKISLISAPTRNREMGMFFKWELAHIKIRVTGSRSENVRCEYS
jgi:hypothetical protein